MFVGVFWRKKWEVQQKGKKLNFWKTLRLFLEIFLRVFGKCLKFTTEQFIFFHTVFWLQKFLLNYGSSTNDVQKSTLKIVVFGEKMPIPVASSKPFFCVRSRLLGLVDQKHEQSQRHKDEEIWMSNTNWRNFSLFSGYPLFLQNHSGKNNQNVSREAKCSLWKSDMWLCPAK